MHIADTLSRAYLPETSETEENLEVLRFHEELENINMVQNLPVSDEAKNAIRVETSKDEDLQALVKAVQKGWPEMKAALPAPVKPYFQLRDELSVQDGVLFRGNRVIIPRSMRADTLKKIHQSHIGINGCLRRARECLYWPSMSAEVKNYISRCTTCRSLDQRQQKETIKFHDVPSRPWAKVGADLCSLNGKDYLVTVDYYSIFAEVDRLSKTTSKSVIKRLKQHFARHGIPDTLITDYGPQFSCQQFREFAEEWQFCHTTSSPGYPQANGKAESAVKTVKRLLKRAFRSGSDPWLALLAVRNTPTEAMQASPAQLLFSRAKTLLPSTDQLLQPHILADIEHRQKTAKAKQATAYNQTAKDLKELSKGQTVRMQPIKGKEWKKAVVSRVLLHRSYEVTAGDGSVYRRNRRHLRCSNEEPPVSTGIPKDDNDSEQELTTAVPTLPTPTAVPERVPPVTTPAAVAPARVTSHETPFSQPHAGRQTPVTEQQTTRSGRIIKTPS